MWEEQGVNMTKILYECMKCSKYIVCMYEMLKNNIHLKPEDNNQFQNWLEKPCHGNQKYLLFLLNICNL